MFLFCQAGSKFFFDLHKVIVNRKTFSNSLNNCLSQFRKHIFLSLKMEQSVSEWSFGPFQIIWNLDLEQLEPFENICNHLGPFWTHEDHEGIFETMHFYHLRPFFNILDNSLPFQMIWYQWGHIIFSNIHYLLFIFYLSFSIIS